MMYTYVTFSLPTSILPFSLVTPRFKLTSSPWSRDRKGLLISLELAPYTPDPLILSVNTVIMAGSLFSLLVFFPLCGAGRDSAYNSWQEGGRVDSLRTTAKTNSMNCRIDHSRQNCLYGRVQCVHKRNIMAFHDIIHIINSLYLLTFLDTLSVCFWL
jgi:hypothetical protein